VLNHLRSAGSLNCSFEPLGKISSFKDCCGAELGMLEGQRLDRTTNSRLHRSERVLVDLLEQL
jgi:hypothetical protein